MTFDDILKKELTPTDAENLRKLKNSSEWNTLKEFVEAHIMRWTYNLLVDDLEKGEEEAFKNVRGFAQGWRTIKRIIENK